MFTRLTEANFRLALTAEEIEELGFLDFDGNTQVEADARITFAIDRAFGICVGFYLKARANGRAIISAANQQLQLSISRQLLDSLRDRPNVRMDYDNAMLILKEASESGDSYAYMQDITAAGLNVERHTANITSKVGPRSVSRSYLDGRLTGWQT